MALPQCMGVGEVADATIQRVALSEAAQISAFDDLGAGVQCDRSGRVRAIVSDHQ